MLAVGVGCCPYPASYKAPTHAPACCPPLQPPACRYECISAEALAEAGAAYDVVLASEVIEHVNRPDEFCRTLARLMRQRSGSLILSTMSRTLPAFALAIVAAEYVTRLVPAGTHDWSRFVTPAELALMAGEAGLQLQHVAGMALRPGSGQWVLTTNLDVNYIAHLRHREPAEATASSPDPHPGDPFQRPP